MFGLYKMIPWRAPKGCGVLPAESRPAKYKFLAAGHRLVSRDTDACRYLGTGSTPLGLASQPAGFKASIHLR